MNIETIYEESPEERCLLEELERLKVEYSQAAAPILDRLCHLRSLRMPMYRISAADARHLGLPLASGDGP
ncbi:hypothetical protein RE428_31730 [Marinobacter nanhaiticus D15-8W]|uniref:Uncharacterized protein n=1 Tax=Marinobacter nanhaiticus D15-8W TaxID=626887 RepID=N6WZE4_9GAMM|nr:hypothetical protein [Marinobacter nanhaiticus]ENO16931.1 hypothetical protein J057_01630 [Marinobacter nanhaiticus D15-8W]BES72155.1 hypothetical protein RE428_31730 [Marinobacter nanhaiticus D15-8W]